MQFCNFSCLFSMNVVVYSSTLVLLILYPVELYFFLPNSMEFFIFLGLYMKFFHMKRDSVASSVHCFHYRTLVKTFRKSFQIYIHISWIYSYILNTHFEYILFWIYLYLRLMIPDRPINNQLIIRTHPFHPDIRASQPLWCP